jgi:hypothetical protein
MSSELFDRAVALVQEADSHISWCRHRHQHHNDENDEQMLDAWIIGARIFEKQVQQTRGPVRA